MRIVGGDGTDINEYPWQAGLVSTNHYDKNKPYCGGSLINNVFVLTAAHCDHYVIHRGSLDHADRAVLPVQGDVEHGGHGVPPFSG